jgi:DNA-binding transcriptional LysR family regulator
MEIRQVRYFMEVAAGGSFNQAAARLHLTQPAVSRQIKALKRSSVSCCWRVGKDRCEFSYN